MNIKSDFGTAIRAFKTGIDDLEFKIGEYHNLFARYSDEVFDIDKLINDASEHKNDFTTAIAKALKRNYDGGNIGDFIYNYLIEPFNDDKAVTLTTKNLFVNRMDFEEVFEESKTKEFIKLLNNFQNAVDSRLKYLSERIIKEINEIYSRYDNPVMKSSLYNSENFENIKINALTKVTQYITSVSGQMTVDMLSIVSGATRAYEYEKAQYMKVANNIIQNYIRLGGSL